MTLRELISVILEVLRNSATTIGVPATNINYGSFGIMPAEAPFIWVYAEPVPQPIAYSGIEDLRRVKFTAFCGASSENQLSSQLLALEYAEKSLISLLTEFPTLIEKAQYGYDQTYADMAVAYLEFESVYLITGAE